MAGEDETGTQKHCRSNVVKLVAATHDVARQKRKEQGRQKEQTGPTEAETRKRMENID